MNVKMEPLMEICFVLFFFFFYSHFRANGFLLVVVFVFGHLSEDSICIECNAGVYFVLV